MMVTKKKSTETDEDKKGRVKVKKLKLNKETVKDLNLRFGDWYFVVNDDVSVQATRTGQTATATALNRRLSPGGPGRPPGPAPVN